jgi:hypothetical protein
VSVGSSASNLPARRDTEPDRDEYEAVDAVPVLDTPREVQQASVAPIVVRAAAVAGASFFAGATAIALVKGRRHRRHRLRLRGRRRGQKVVASHSFLVDVHVLGR